MKWTFKITIGFECLQYIRILTKLPFQNYWIFKRDFLWLPHFLIGSCTNKWLLYWQDGPFFIGSLPETIWTCWAEPIGIDGFVVRSLLQLRCYCAGGHLRLMNSHVSQPHEQHIVKKQSRHGITIYGRYLRHCGPSTAERRLTVGSDCERSIRLAWRWPNRSASAFTRKRHLVHSFTVASSVTVFAWIGLYGLKNCASRTHLWHQFVFQTSGPDFGCVWGFYLLQPGIPRERENVFHDHIDQLQRRAWNDAKRLHKFRLIAPLTWFISFIMIAAQTLRR